MNDKLSGAEIYAINDLITRAQDREKELEVARKAAEAAKKMIREMAISVITDHGFDAAKYIVNMNTFTIIPIPEDQLKMVEPKVG